MSKGKEKAPVVSVEMTEEQKEKFLDFAAKEAAEAEIPVEGRSQVNLRTAHWINGLQYGPGQVIVPDSIASHLYVSDQNWYLSQLSQQDSKLVHIHMAQNGLKKIETKKAESESGIVKV